MNKIVLLVVDVQNALIEAHPYNEKRVTENIKKLIRVAIEADKEVIYVCHDDGVGTDLEKGSHGWQIYGEIADKNDKLIIEKQYNSAFHKTQLSRYLADKNIDTIMLVGLQTEYCIDATVKSAFDQGYKIIIPEETNTTYDNEYLSGEKLYQYYNQTIWNDRFAKVIPINDAVKILKS